MVDEILIMVKVILLKWRQNFLQVSRILFSVLLPGYEQYEEAGQKNLKISMRERKKRSCIRNL